MAPGLRTRPRGRTFFELRNYSQKINHPTLKTDLESAWNSGLSCVSVTFISWSPSFSRVSWSSTVAPFHFLGPYFFCEPMPRLKKGDEVLEVRKQSRLLLRKWRKASEVILKFRRRNMNGVIWLKFWSHIWERSFEKVIAEAASGHFIGPIIGIRLRKGNEWVLPEDFP